MATTAATKFEEILYQVKDQVATVTLNRPDKLNAWTPTMQREVYSVMTQAEKDENVRVIILTGAGRAFCAGADIQNLDSLAGGRVDPDRLKKDWLAYSPREGA